MAGSCIPFHRASEAGIEIGRTFGEAAEFERAAGRKEVFYLERSEVVVGLGIPVRAAGNDHETVLAGLPRCDAFRAALVGEAEDLAGSACHVQSGLRRDMHDPEDWPAVFDQGYIYGEFAVAIDEFARAVQRVDQPKRTRADVRNLARCHTLLGDGGYRRRELGEPRQNDLFCRFIRRSDRRVVELGTGGEIRVVDASPASRAMSRSAWAISVRLLVLN
jgi:hypothetical protein